MQSGLPADAASLRETGSVDRYTPAWARVPSNSVASCGAVSCLINTLADGAETTVRYIVYNIYALVLSS